MPKFKLQGTLSLITTVQCQHLRAFNSEHRSNSLILPRFRESPIKQKAVDNLCFAQVSSLEADLDLTDYLTKPVNKTKGECIYYTNFHHCITATD